MKNMQRHAPMALVLVLVCALTLAFAACNAAPATGGSSTATTTAPTPTGTTVTTAAPSTPARTTYTITVVDENGNPIVGAEMKLCDGDNCLLPRSTDANGRVTFVTNLPLNWAAAFTERPEGYVCEAEYHFASGETSLTITLTAA